MNSDRCKLDVNKLSSESRDTFDHTSHNALYICQMCINRHEGHEDSSTNFDEPAQDTSLDTSFDTFVDFGSSEPAESYVSVSAEHIFEEKNKSMKSLIVLCCGLKNSIFDSFKMDTAQREKSELRTILVNLRAERRRLELMDMDIVEPSKKQKIDAQLTAIAEEISDLTEEMNIAKDAATPPRGGSKRS